MENFTKLQDSLRRTNINKIPSTEKIFFAYILGWQESNKTLTASNKYIANELGMTYDGVRTLIKRCNQRFDFFSSTQTDIDSENGSYSSGHVIKINTKLFNAFLNEKPNSVPNEVKVETEVVTPEVEEVPLESIFGEQVDLYDLIKEVESETKPEEVDEVKEELRIMFKEYFGKYAANSPISPRDFNQLTGDYFLDKMNIFEISSAIKGLTQTNFESFYDLTQELQLTFIQKQA